LRKINANLAKGDDNFLANFGPNERELSRGINNYNHVAIWVVEIHACNSFIGFTVYINFFIYKVKNTDTKQSNN